MKNDISIEIIASGSTGNATLINNDILLDCGVPFKKLKPYYKNIKLVFISHIHGDHFNKATIKKLAEERPVLRFAIGEYLVKEKYALNILLYATKNEMTLEEIEKEVYAIWYGLDCKYYDCEAE